MNIFHDDVLELVILSHLSGFLVSDFNVVWLTECIKTSTVEHHKVLYSIPLKSSKQLSLASLVVSSAHVVFKAIDI